MSNNTGLSSLPTGAPLPIMDRSRNEVRKHLAVPEKSHRRSLSSSTTSSSKLQLSDNASERNPDDDSQTELSSQDPQWQDRIELDNKPSKKPSPSFGPFRHGQEDPPSWSLQSDVRQKIKEFQGDSDLPEPDLQNSNPAARDLLRIALNKYSDDPHSHTPQNLQEATAQSLSDQIFLAAVKSCGLDKRINQSFYPPSVLVNLLDYTNVLKELKLYQAQANWSDDKIRTLADLICPKVEEIVSLPNGRKATRSFRPILALLVRMGLVKLVDDFIRDNVTSLDLPLCKVMDRRGNITGFKRKSLSDEPDDVALRCFSGWQLHNLEVFYERQWQFVPHTFQRSEYDEISLAELDESTILPFVPPPDDHGRPSSGGPISLGKGGSGEVIKCYIHPDFQNFLDKDNITGNCVAIKVLKETISDEMCQRELNVLRKFCGVNAKKHIVAPLAVYKQFGQHHLVFACAEMNLYEYWMKYDRPPALDYEWILWIAGQNAAVTDAIFLVHQHEALPDSARREQSPYRYTSPAKLSKSGGGRSAQLRKKHRPFTTKASVGRCTDCVIIGGLHGDVKPENLLLFSPDITTDRGLIKLSDFGEGEMTPSVRGSRRRPNAARTLTYRAPECDIRPDSVSPASDVWSLGCVLLEFVTWSLGGGQYVKQFARKRLKDDIFDELGRSDTFFEFARGADRGLGVRVKPEVTRFIEDLHAHENCTDYFHDLLNIIQDRMLVVDSVYRKQCDCHSVLQVLYNKCKESISYATNARPRKRKASKIYLLRLKESDVEKKQSEKISYNMNRLEKHYGPARWSVRGGKSGAPWRKKTFSF